MANCAFSNLYTIKPLTITVLEANRFSCEERTASGTAFEVDPAQIFSQTLLPSTIGSSTPSPSNGPENLTLIIALPVVFFVLLVCGTTLCCFFFIRWRRRRARDRRRSKHLQTYWNDGDMSSPTQSWDAQYGSRFGFMDNDGRGQDVGYSKPGFVEVTEPTIHARSTEHEKGGVETYFHPVNA